MPDIPLDELQEQVTRERMLAVVNARLRQTDAAHCWVSEYRRGLMTFTMDFTIANPALARCELADLLRSAAESLDNT